MPLGTEVGLPQRGTALLSIFGPCPLWPNSWMHQDVTWWRSRSRPRQHCVRWKPSSPRGTAHAPNFSVHVCCGQMVGWIKISLGTEVGLGPGHIVLDGSQLPLPKGAQQPHLFGPCLLLPNSRPSQLLLSTGAPLTAECRRACPGISFSLKIGPSHGGCGSHLKHT